MQEACVRLMGKKLLVSLAMEGKFASEGLQATDEGDDILMAMARELVTEKGIGESADLVWKQLQKQQAEVFGARTAEALPPEGEADPLTGMRPGYYSTALGPGSCDTTLDVWQFARKSAQAQGSTAHHVGYRSVEPIGSVLTHPK